MCLHTLTKSNDKCCYSLADRVPFLTSQATNHRTFVRTFVWTEAKKKKNKKIKDVDDSWLSQVPEKYRFIGNFILVMLFKYCKNIWE